jgi:hypothetical protein
LGDRTRRHDQQAGDNAPKKEPHPSIIYQAAPKAGILWFGNEAVYTWGCLSPRGNCALTVWTTLHLHHPFRLEPRRPHPIAWEAALRVEAESWSEAAPSRIVVPQGFAWIELKSGICFQSEPSGIRQIFARRNGDDERPGGYRHGYLSQTHTGGWAAAHSVSFSAESAIMPVSAGDYFELLAYHTADSPLWVGGAPPGDNPQTMPAFGCVYFEAKFYP